MEIAPGRNRISRIGRGGKHAIYIVPHAWAGVKMVVCWTRHCWGQTIKKGWSGRARPGTNGKSRLTDCRRLMDKKELKEKIRKVFQGVELGNGMGLWQAYAYDLNWGNYALSEYGDHNERRDWSVLSAESLNRAHTAPCFFDPDGMRFHLPAYLLLEIDGNLNLDFVNHLFRTENIFAWYPDESQFETLNEAQRQAVSEFLRWCLTQEKYEFDWSQIETALRHFWELPERELNRLRAW